MTDDEIASACRAIAETKPRAAVLVLFLPDGSLDVRTFNGEVGEGFDELRGIAGLALLNGPEVESEQNG